MKSFITLLLIGIISFQTTGKIMAQENKSYPYDSVAGDPLKARIYTLDNGLKVFISVYKDAPRIQTYVAVRVGSKNDPAETTGLAHYFEHMMFKGTQQFGTSDWSKEQLLIEEIDGLFEVYRNERDDQERAAIYRRIDSLSFEASKIAIPNEYDKLMDAIGSQGSNAGTSNDYTIYMENIPANQVENWAKVQADRFSKPVLRLFHTEVETVYEEKNRSLTNDGRKVSEQTLKILFPNHPYGQQTTLGESEHLKNPSMKNIREFFAKYYVPNNMALCLSGDMDPDATIRTIDQYFGKLKSSEIPSFTYGPFKPLDKPVEQTITGLEAENIRISFGFDADANSQDALILRMIGTILYNGKAGLIDLNINQEQKVLGAYAYPGIMNDYAYLSLSARPKTGQSLEEVKSLLLEQVDLLKKGDFPDWMLEAAINNFTLDQIRQFQGNQGRAMTMASAFLANIPYEKSVRFLEDIAEIKKEDIVSFANKYMGDNYVVIYKKQGPAEEVARIPKPPITPIQINYKDESAFLKEIKNKQVIAIDPVFLDYSKDLTTNTLKNGIRLLCNENKEDDLFTLTYHYKAGRNNDKELNFALSLLPYLGTSKMSAAEIKQELYRLACDMDINSREEESTITISGLGANFEKAVALAEGLLNDCQPDQKALENLVNNVLKARSDAKSNQQEVFNYLVSYGMYGTNSPSRNIIPESLLKSLKAENLVSRIHGLKDMKHQVLYYGPMAADKITSRLPKIHEAGKTLQDPPGMIIFKEKETDQNKVYFVHYDARQTRLQTMIREQIYDPKLTADVTLFGYYMGNLSFAELREKRALAYTAYSRIQTPPDLMRPYIAVGFIGTQNDKMIEAFKALNELYNEMPLSETGFSNAKEAVISKIRTERISRMNLLWNFIDAEKHGLNYDIRKEVFEQVQLMKSEDLRAFQEKFLKNRTKTYLVLGKESEMDFQGLEQFGPVTRLTLEEVFGY